MRSWQCTDALSRIPIDIKGSSRGTMHRRFQLVGLIVDVFLCGPEAGNWTGFVAIFDIPTW